MRVLALTLALCLTISASLSADTVFYNDALTASSPTFDAPGGSGVGTALQHYHVQQFTVDTAGAYTFETASPNTGATVSNALDTLLVLYANTFVPSTPAGNLFSNDDFTGVLTVLPGPYAGTVTGSGTGFSGAQPASRVAAFALTAGTQYFLINSSFRSTDFVSTNLNGQPVGAFYTGITGPGTITLAGIPEPSSLLVLGLAGMALGFRRKRA